MAGVALKRLDEQMVCWGCNHCGKCGLFNTSGGLVCARCGSPIYPGDAQCNVCGSRKTQVCSAKQNNISTTHLNNINKASNKY